MFFVFMYFLPDMIDLSLYNANKELIKWCFMTMMMLVGDVRDKIKNKQLPGKAHDKNDL